MRACLYEGCTAVVEDATWGMSFCPQHHPDFVLERRLTPRKDRVPAEYCGRGHAFTPENTYRFSNGTRKCKTCAKMNRDRNYKPRSHCKHGHAFTDENTRVTPSGRRLCLTCEKERAKASPTPPKAVIKTPGKPPRRLSKECIHGHVFTPENTEYTKTGRRVCVECQRQRRVEKRLARDSVHCIHGHWWGDRERLKETAQGCLDCRRELDRLYFKKRKSA